MKRVFIGLVAVLAVTSMANAQSVTNGSFTTDISGWTQGRAGWGNQDANLNLRWHDPNAGVWTVGTSPDGGSAAGVDYGGDLAGSRWFAQEVTGLTIGQTYTLSGYIAGGVGAAQSLPSNFEGWYQLGYVPGAYSAGTLDSGTGCVNVASTSLVGSNAQGFGWVAGTGDFVATDTTYTIYFKYGAVNANWNYYSAYVDGVSLTPEPAALMLLALGLPMLRRRR